jgi:hypothetical protein
VCTTGDTAHIDTRQHVDVCVWQELEYRIDVCRVTRSKYIHRTSLVVNKNFFSFTVAVNISIKVGPLVFLL